MIKILLTGLGRQQTQKPLYPSDKSVFSDFSDKYKYKEIHHYYENSYARKKN